MILLAIAAGSLVALESRHKTLRIVEIEAGPAAADLVSETIWAGIPKIAERFWPLLWISRRTYEAAIESAHPVNANLRFKGWGKFKVETEYLHPLFRVYWENKNWYVSSDGRMWPDKLQENYWMDLEQIRARPALAWGKDMAAPFGTAAVGEVRNSSLPMDKISGWYDTLEFLGWNEKVRVMFAGRRDGMPVVRLVFKGPNDAGVSVLFPDSPELWRGLGMAVKKIYPDIAKISPDIFIDATYKDKIIVGNKVQ